MQPIGLNLSQARNFWYSLMFKAYEDALSFEKPENKEAAFKQYFMYVEIHRALCYVSEPNHPLEKKHEHDSLLDKRHEILEKVKQEERQCHTLQ